jgi:hypothetical protein
MTRRMSPARLFLVAAFVLLALTLVPIALADKGGGGHSSTNGGGHHSGGGGSSCTQNTPGVVVQNNWAWGQTGSWGLPGQQLGYDIQVINYDVGCGSSDFVVAVSAPSGFSVSLPTSTISLDSSASGYLWAYVSSPSVAADGDDPLTVSVERANATGPAATATTYYKVYSADATVPTLFYPNPWEDESIGGSSYMVNVSSSDDHAVQKIDLYIDHSYVTTTACANITYTCRLSYNWRLHGLAGPHTVTFESTDWMGNVGSLTVSFTVSK